MDMIYEVKAWMFNCNVCGKESGPVFSQFTPAIPADWSYREHHDCGLTGYSRMDIRCADCTLKYVLPKVDGTPVTHGA
jgi:hypothetical protein